MNVRAMPSQIMASMKEDVGTVSAAIFLSAQELGAMSTIECLSASHDQRAGQHHGIHADAQWQGLQWEAMHASLSHEADSLSLKQCAT